jgi:hypothetical protein
MGAGPAGRADTESDAPPRAVNHAYCIHYDLPMPFRRLDSLLYFRLIIFFLPVLPSSLICPKQWRSASYKCNLGYISLSICICHGHSIHDRHAHITQGK